MDEARAWELRDPAAVQWLAAHYDRMVTRTLEEQGFGADPERDDLAQEARLALVRAIRAFDPARGHRFTSFAIPRLIGAVREYRRTRGSWVRRSGQRAQAAVDAAVRALEARGEAVTDAALQALLARPGDLARARRLPVLVHLSEEAQAAVEDELPDPRLDLPAAVEARAVARCLERLPWLQREAVRGVYVERRPAGEVAAALGIRVTLLRREVLPEGRKRLARYLGWEAGVKVVPPCRCWDRMTPRRPARILHYRDTPENLAELARLAQERGISSAELLRQLARGAAREAAAVKSKQGGKR